MKTEIGKIIIGKKVYFEYCNNNLCKNYNTLFRRCKYFNGYCDEKEAYEASKRLIKVSNFWCEFRSGIRMIINEEMEHIKNNQLCKAEVNGTAKIIELIK